jgi:hypothetical protein
MAVSREFLVKLVGDAKSLISTFDKVGKEATATLGKGGLGGKLMDLLPSFKTISIAGTAAFGAVSAAAGLAVKAAAEDAESQARLAQALNTTFGESKQLVAATEEFITSMSQAAAVSDDQLRPAMTTLVRATGDLKQSQDLLKLALDISAGSGRDLETVTIALARASQGQVSALTRLGVPLDQAAVKTKDFEAITRTLADTFEGAAAASADSAQGRFRAFGIAVDELREQFGEMLLPALTDVTDYLTRTVIPAFSMAIEAFRSQGVKSALAVFVAAFGQAGIAILDQLEGVAVGVYKFMEGVVATLSPLFAAIDLVRSVLALGKPIESIQAGIARRTQEVQGAFDGFRDSVSQASKRLEVIAAGPMDVVERRLAQVGRTARGTKSDLGDLGDEAGRTGGKTKKAADDVKTFQERLKDYTSAVKSAKSASDAFGRSQERASEARVSLADADKALAKAQEDLAKAQQGGSPEQIAAANRRVAAAERTVARAKFDVEESVIAVRDAERELAELRQDPEATPDQIRKAEIRLAEAKFAVVDAEDRQIEVATDLTEARRQLRIATEGLREGDEELIPFQAAVEDLTKRQTDAAKRYKEALEEQTEALQEYTEALAALQAVAATVPKVAGANPVTGLIPVPPTPVSDQRIMPETAATTVVVNVTAGIGGNAYQVGKEIIEVLDQYTSVAGPLDTLMRVA